MCVERGPASAAEVSSTSLAKVNELGRSIVPAYVHEEVVGVFLVCAADAVLECGEREISEDWNL
jgi:hypothetical protein